jgi:hypothetical protein
MRFERNILRKIYILTKLVDGTWKIKTNDECDSLMEHKNTIHFIKAQTLNGLGHVERMLKERDVRKYINGS